MKKIRIILGIIISLAVVVAGSFFWVKQVNDSNLSFIKSGYVIKSSNIENNEDKTSRYYFNDETTYKNSVDDNVVFNDLENNKVKVSKESFLHYDDSSIGTLKKSVIIELHSIINKRNVYYNFFENQVLYKDGDSYYVEHLNDKLKFENFIIKVSENKYMVVFKNVNLNIDDTNKKIENNYLEITFKDKGIVRIENQEYSFQSVAEKIEMIFDDDLKLNLKDKSFYKGEEKLLQLDQITIDKDDNIKINDSKKTTTTSKTTTTKKKNNKNNSNIKQTTSPVGDLGNGVISSDDSEKEVDENEKTEDPVFSVNDMTVSSNKLKAGVKIKDDYSMLSSELDIKIIELTTGKVVYSRQEDMLIYDFDIEVENLKPDTNYIFKISAEYTKKDATYTKDFVQKTFRTEPLGVSLKKDYFTTNSLAYYVEVSSYSKVKQLTATLLNKQGDVISEQNVKLEGLEDNKAYFSFNSLSSNKEYTVVLDDFYYENYIVSDTFEIKQTNKTLKEKPTLGIPEFKIDKKNSEFKLSTSSIIDKQSGIKSYKYEIYDARDTTRETPVKTITKDSKGEVSVSVNGEPIERGVPYVYKLITEFDDNEKITEYETGESALMVLDGLNFPTIRFQEKEVTFEKIDGTIIITDDDETIDLNTYNGIKVVYTDSIGTKNQFSTSGSLEIPFNRNNLRANETYTISVYANINLQDGNLPAEDCLIGSIIIKTKQTKAFGTSFSTKNDDSLIPFNVSAMLTDYDGSDNTLEANTLTGVTFKLYEGMNTNGRLVKSVLKVDKDDNYYSSTLKTNYYDNEFTINPEFFGLNNSDIDGEYYTIEIIGAYDYTIYKNDIPIKNNTITVKSKGSIPDLPPDENDAIQIKNIYNKDAGDKYREDLDPTTIIGYSIKADFNNSSLYAKTINYKVYLEDGTLVDERVSKVNSDGTLNQEVFYLGDGTPYKTKDTKLVRGNKYYFTYTATLVINDKEITYPSSDVILKSKTVTAEKQQALFKLYPSTSDDKTFLWKYTLKDVDNALTDKIASYTLANSTKNIEMSESNDYQDLLLSTPASGNLKLNVKENLIKSEQIDNRTLINQYFDNKYDFKGVTFISTVDNNRVLIGIKNYDVTNELYKRISALKIEFTSGDKKVTKDNVKLENGYAVVDLKDIQTMMNEKIKVRVYCYYDTGVTGFDTKGNLFAITELKNSDYDGEYYSINQEGDLKINPSALNSIFETSFNKENLLLTSKINNKSKKLNININDKGVNYNYQYILMKLLDSKEIEPEDGFDTIKFDKIIPGISVRNAAGELDVAASTTSAEINAKFYGSNSDIKDNSIIVKLYELDKDFKTGDLVEEKTVSIDKLSEHIRFENLMPNKNYGFQIFAMVSNGTDYTLEQLYDVDSKSSSERYDFITLKGIEINDIKIKLTASNYENKKMNLSYTLSQVLGYDAIKYIVQRKNKDKWETVLTYEDNSETIHKKEIVKQFDANTGSIFKAGASYRFIIIPVAYIKVDDVVKEVNLQSYDATYDLYQLTKPNFIVKYEYRDNYQKLRFKINVKDSNGVVVNNNYKVIITDLDGNDVTPSNVKGTLYNTSTINNFIDLNNYDKNKQYIITITYKEDLDNTGENIEDATKTYMTRTLSGDTDVGTVYVTTNLEDQTKANLVFYDSLNLTNITKVRYSIYNLSGYANDGVSDFIPKLVTDESGSSYYVYNLPQLFQDSGLYYIQVQFIDSSGKIISDKTLEYNYIK